MKKAENVSFMSNWLQTRSVFKKVESYLFYFITHDLSVT